MVKKNDIRKPIQLLGWMTFGEKIFGNYFIFALILFFCFFGFAGGASDNAVGIKR